MSGACGGPPAEPDAGADDSRGLVVVGATLISPELSAPLENAWVSVVEGRITGVGSGDPPPSIAAFERLPAVGRFLIPGLIDSHVHLGSIPGMAFEEQEAYPDLVEAYFRQLPRSYLYHGFTTVIDLAVNDPEPLRRLEAAPDHPDLFGCGPSLPLANGYPMRFAPPEVRFEIFPNFLYDPRQAEAIPDRYLPQDHSPAAAVRRVQEMGGICVKTYVEDGFGTRKDWPLPTADMLQEVRSEAHEAGIPLVVHANSHDAYQLALDGGADVIVHGLWTWDAYQAADDGETLPPEISALLDRMLSEGVAIMPTLQVITGDRALFAPTFLEDPALERVLPAELLAWYATEEGQWFGRLLLEDMPPEVRSPEVAYRDHSRALSRVGRATAYLARQGAPLLYGSDTPSGPSYGNPPGYNGYLELQALSRSGLPLDRLLAAATLDNARAFGLEESYGSVEPGKIANLLLLTANPLESAEAYGSIETVLLHGRPIGRDSLAAETSP